MPWQRISTKLERYRVTVPPYLNQTVPPIYLGMPPLPLTINEPLIGGNKNANTVNLRGISVGRVDVTPETSSPKSLDERNNLINYGSDQSTNNKGRRKNTSVKGNIKSRSSRVSRGNKKNSKKAQAVLLKKRSSNGRFKKK